MTMTVREFIQALIQHIPDRNFKTIRYYGAYSRRTKGKYSKILEKLKEQSKYVEWNNGIRKEYFGIIGKRIEGKDELRGMGFVVLDLDDF